METGIQLEGNRPSPALSIVSTLYRSRPFLETFLREVREAVAASQVDSFELVLVNDGSPDDSLACALAHQQEFPQLVIVDLSRNFGHHAAALAGLQCARGDLVFLIDCDLEVPPGVLPDFLTKLHETRSDMVYGFQAIRKGGGLERVGGGLFWKAFNLLSDTAMPENIVTERLMTRRFLNAFLCLGDRNLFLAGMMSWAGFLQVGLPVEKQQRHGKSTYTFAKRAALMVNALSSFSALPLLVLFWCGLSITGLSFLAGLYLLIRRLLFNDLVPGFTALTVLIVTVLGILTTGLGLLGIYLGKVFTQVQGRPSYIVRDIYH